MAGHFLHIWRSKQHATSHSLEGFPELLRIRDRCHCTLGLGELVSMLYFSLAVEHIVHLRCTPYSLFLSDTVQVPGLA